LIRTILHIKRFKKDKNQIIICETADSCVVLMVAGVDVVSRRSVHDA